MVLAGEVRLPWCVSLVIRSSGVRLGSYRGTGSYVAKSSSSAIEVITLLTIALIDSFKMLGTCPWLVPQETRMLLCEIILEQVELF